MIYSLGFKKKTRKKEGALGLHSYAIAIIYLCMHMRSCTRIRSLSGLVQIHTGTHSACIHQHMHTYGHTHGTWYVIRHWAMQDRGNFKHDWRADVGQKFIGGM